MNLKESYSLDELYSYLRKFHLSESLYTIGAINSALKYGSNTYFPTNIPPYILEWLSKFGDKSVSNLEIILQTSRMARLLLLSGASDYRHRMLILGTQEFNTAFNMIGRLDDLDGEPENKNELYINRIFARMSAWQFPLQADRLISLGRAYLLFIKIPSASPEGDYDYNKKMKEFFGITALEYLISGYCMWLMTNGTLDYEPKIEVATLRKIITEENLKVMVKLITGTPEQYRRLIRGEDFNIVNRHRDLHALDPFLTIPAIAVKNSSKLRSDSYVVPQPKYLLDKISTGIFYLLADKERTIAQLQGKANRKNSFRNSFGSVYRQYVKMQLEQLHKPAALIDLDNDFINDMRTKMPDFALITEDICVLFEVKTSLLKIETRTFFEEDQLKEEVKKGGMEEALTQLNTFRQRIINKTMTDIRFQNVSTVVSVLVCYEDIYVLNSSLLPLLKQYYPTLTESLQLACISDIDAIGDSLFKKVNLGKVLVEKINNPSTETNMLAVTLESRVGRSNQLLKQAFQSFQKDLGV